MPTKFLVLGVFGLFFGGGGKVPIHGRRDFSELLRKQ